MSVTGARVLVFLLLLGCNFAPTWALGGEPSKPSTQRPDTSPRPRMTVEEAERVREEGWSKPRIPASADIESIVAEAYCHPLPVADVAPFVVPKKYYDDLLKHFREAERDKSPSTVDQELGTIRLVFRGGSSIRICWFSAGHKNRLHFSWCGMRYRATGERFADDETLAVDALIRRIHSKEVLHEDGRSTPLSLPNRG